jgi:hypothetical protein
MGLTSEASPSSRPGSTETELQPLSDEQIQSFRRQGYLHVPGFLPQERVAALRAACDAYFAAGNGREAGHGKVEGDIPRRMAEVSWLLTYPPALGIAQQLVGVTVMHPHETAVHISTVNRGWHKDARDYAHNDPNGTDWQDDYRLCHFAYYLQDHTDYSGGISFKRGSHRIKNHIEGQPVTIDSRAGDLVIFDLRTTHMGNTLKLKPQYRWIPRSLVLPLPWARFYRRALQPQRLLQPLLARQSWLYLPEHRDRLAIFFVYGADDLHTRNFFAYLRARPEYPYLQDYDEPARLT